MKDTRKQNTVNGIVTIKQNKNNEAFNKDIDR